MIYDSILNLNNRNKENYRELVKNRKERLYYGSVKLALDREKGFFLISKNSTTTYNLGFDVFKFICWLERNSFCYISNISFLKQNINKLKYFSFDDSILNNVRKSLKNINIRKFYVKKSSDLDIGKLVLLGFEVLYKGYDCITVLYKKDIVYLCCDYLMIVETKKFPFKDYLYGCDYLSIENWSVGKQTDIREYFSYLYAIEKIDIKEFYAVDVVIMSHMFFGCMSLIDLNLIGFFVDANLISGLSLFGECKSLHNLKLNTVVYKIIENECNNLGNYFKKTIDLVVV